MQKRMVTRCAMAAFLLLSAAAPVWAALEGRIDYSVSVAPGIDFDTVGSIEPASYQEPDCGPVYAPSLVRERDGSIVGVKYILDGDDC